MKKALSLLLLLPLASCGGNSVTSVTSPSSSSEEVEEIEIKYEIPADEDIPSSVAEANGEAMDVATVKRLLGHPLSGKTIYFLGSSVTYGASSNGVAMGEYLQAKTGCISKKDAVSGTTIFDDNKTANTGVNSYTRRLVNSTVFDKNEKVDAFICQISTNDSTNDRLTKRGNITADDVLDMEEFDRTTTLGGIEFIISYVTEYWNCPVYFYSGGYFSDGTNKANRENSNPKGSEYGKLVGQVKQIAEKWEKVDYAHVAVIDMFNDKEFNAVASDKYYSFAMADPIHPRKAGYRQWWTPYIEAFLTRETNNYQF